jgi:2-haloacid dehalogenase
MGVAAVVFDVGQVLVQWDPRHLYRTLFPDPDRMEFFLSEVCTPAWNLELDRGMDWDEALSERIARYPSFEREIRAFWERWDEMVPGAIDGTVRLLEALAADGIPLFALTNFNARTFARTRARFPFFRHLRGAVVSGEEGIVKPDARIYRLLTARYGLDPPQTLFIDDVHANVEAAQECGWQGLRFTDPGALREDLARLGLICAGVSP